jgi:hypothetical protein
MKRLWRRTRLRPRMWYFAPFIYPIMCLYSHVKSGEWLLERNAFKAVFAITLILIIDHDPAKRRAAKARRDAGRGR